MRYAVIIEKGRFHYGAYVPDLPECSAVGQTVEEVKTSIYASISAHLNSLKAEGNDFPNPRTLCEYVDVS
ncbi:type II toxin-antitoxin system HicB family antitoxin [Crocosphaera sp.]|uniref:type II toxin-antitoxin system HicB family antitoxin n=1 Tax=Crocosphaera sp. TaxID=2729996 RepID=UPI003F25DE24|nr:type II toxin-antitoxin system HicB family antitoxin [Crocosphaera sp.]